MQQDHTEVSDDHKFLGDLMGSIATGSPMTAEMVGKLQTLLTNFQTKVDLAQVGLARYHMSRARKLSRLISVIEDTIIPPDAESVTLPEGERAELLKHFSKELAVSTEFLMSKATKPTISSPEGMKNSVGDDTSSKKQVGVSISPEARQRIRNLALSLKSRLLSGPVVDV